MSSPFPSLTFLPSSFVFLAPSFTFLSGSSTFLCSLAVLFEVSVLGCRADA